MYRYRMIQVPPTIPVSRSQEGTAAAEYMEEVVNAQAAEGWEFYRVDEIGIEVKPGCLSSIFGRKSEMVPYYVLTFRQSSETE